MDLPVVPPVVAIRNSVTFALITVVLAVALGRDIPGLGVLTTLAIVLLAIVLFGYDMFWQFAFKAIGVLQ